MVVAEEAAVVAQTALGSEKWPEKTPIRVRIGVHTGEAQERDGDYFGTALNRAARIMGLGSGGQVLMSAATAELVDVDRQSEGVCELRGVADRTEVFTVLIDGLQSEFPALRAAATPSNLPTVGPRLVGREADLEELTQRMASARLLTLVGPGGIGKTSLAVELARRLTDRFPGGVWWVELAPVRDPDAVVAVLASAVGARSEGGGSLLDAVLEVLGAGPVLVLLDNCEHLADASSELAQLLLAVPSTSVIATSRVPLHLRDEHVWSVAPLGYEGHHSNAAWLFAERAAIHRKAVPEGFPIVQGIGIASGAGQMDTTEELAVQIMLARQAGAVGFVGFAYQPKHTSKLFSPLRGEQGNR